MIMWSIQKMFDIAYKTAAERTWDTIYVMVDIHGTIVHNNYSGIAITPYPRAVEALKMLSDRKDIVLILFSSCYPQDYKIYFDLFSSFGINFKYFNENPSIQNTKTGCFDKKPYFSILLDDKAGFDPDMDWDTILEYYAQRG